MVECRLYKLVVILVQRTDSWGCWVVCLAAERGDYVEAEFGYGPAYLKSMKLLPRQTEQLEMKIMGHHREHL